VTPSFRRSQPAGGQSKQFTGKPLGEQLPAAFLLREIGAGSIISTSRYFGEAQLMNRNHLLAGMILILLWAGMASPRFYVEVRYRFHY